MIWKQRVRWQKAIEESNSVETLPQRVQSVVPSVFFSVFFAFLFWLVSVWSLTEWLGVERPEVSQMVLLVLLLFCIGTVQEILEYLLGVKGRACVVLLAGVGVIIAGYILLRGEELWKEASGAYPEEGLYLVMCLTFIVALIFARYMQKNEVLLLPALLLLLFLLTKETVAPKEAWFVLLAGILLSRSLKWEKADMQPTRYQEAGVYKGKSFVWFLKGIGISLLCGVILLAGAGIAQKTIEKNAGKVLSIASKLQQTMDEWELSNGISVFHLFSGSAWRLFRDSTLDVEQLDNHHLQYLQVEVLQVESDDKPVENIYLRGFCGDIYEEGSWKRDLDTLEQFCRDTEMDYDAVRAQIAFLTPRRLQEQYGQGGTTENANMRQIRVCYTGLLSEVVYYPYFSQVESKGIGLAGDSGFTKKEKADALTFRQWKIGEQELTQKEVSKTGWDLWYEEYVKNYYLETSEELPAVREIAGQIENTLSEDADMLAKVQAVVCWLDNNTTYSLTPPILPENTDAIEFFLQEGKSGYCVHYASAAVMLLRELGVPARYASGYMVEAEAFVAGENVFSAPVLDDRAHAWVEIYLETIGWVPVEVTPGYPMVEVTEELADKLQPQEESNGIGGVLSGNDVKQEGERYSAASGEGSSIIEQVDVQPTQSPDAETDPEEDVDEEPESTGDEGHTEQNTDESEDADEEETSQEEALTEEEVAEEEKKIVMITPPPAQKEVFVADTQDTTRKIIIGVLGVLIVVGVLVVLVADTHKFFRKESVYYKQLRKEIKRGNHRQVIMMINSGIYRKLYFKKLLGEGRGDEAYARALKDNYKDLSEEEWDRYMVIVKQVAFSEDIFSEEDVKYCFDIYRDVIYKDEVW